MSASGPKLGRGCSRRPQFQATRAPSPAAKQIVLATGRGHLLEAAQLGGEIVALPKDGDGYASGLEPQQSRVPLRRCPAGRKLAASTRTRDVGFRAKARSRSASASAVSSDAVTATSSVAWTAGEASRPRKRVSGSLPVGSAAASNSSARLHSPSKEATWHVSGGDVVIVRPEPVADRVREQDRARSPDLNVERVPDDRPPVGVQEHRDLVVRRVLELLHHQLSALRSRPPVHLAKRLALLVLAHAVQIEAGGPAQQQPAAAWLRPAFCEKRRSSSTSRG